MLRGSGCIRPEFENYIPIEPEYGKKKFFDKQPDLNLLKKFQRSAFQPKSNKIYPKLNIVIEKYSLILFLASILSSILKNERVNFSYIQRFIFSSETAIF